MTNGERGKPNGEIIRGTEGQGISSQDLSPEIIAPGEHKSDIIERLLTWDGTQVISAAEIVVALEDCFQAQGGFEFHAQLWSREEGLAAEEQKAREVAVRHIRELTDRFMERLGEAVRENPNITTNDKRLNTYVRKVCQTLSRTDCQAFFRFWQGSEQTRDIEQKEDQHEELLPEDFDPAWYTYQEIGEATALVAADVEDYLCDNGLYEEYREAVERVFGVLDTHLARADDSGALYEDDEYSLLDIQAGLGDEKIWRRFCELVQNHPEILLLLIGQPQVYKDTYGLGEVAAEKQTEELRTRMGNMFAIAIVGSEVGLGSDSEQRRVAESGALEELYGERLPQQLRYTEEALWLQVQIAELVDDIQDEVAEQERDIFMQDLLTLTRKKGRMSPREIVEMNFPVLTKGLGAVMDWYKKYNEYREEYVIDNDKVGENFEKVERVLIVWNYIHRVIKRMLAEAERNERTGDKYDKTEAVQKEHELYQWTHQALQFVNKRELDRKKLCRGIQGKLRYGSRRFKQVEEPVGDEDVAVANHTYVSAVRRRITDESFVQPVAGEHAVGSDFFYQELPSYLRDFSGFNFCLGSHKRFPEGFDFQNMNGRYTDWDGAYFGDKANFSGGDFTGATLKEAHFDQLIMVDAQAPRADFTRTTYASCVQDLRGSNLAGATFDNIFLSRPTQGNIGRYPEYFLNEGGPLMDFSGANLSGASIKKAALGPLPPLFVQDRFGNRNVNMRFQNLIGCVFNRADLTGTKFDGSFLDRCLFSDAKGLTPGIRKNLYRNTTVENQYMVQTHGGCKDDFIYYTPEQIEVYRAYLQKKAEERKKMEEEQKKKRR